MKKTFLPALFIISCAAVGSFAQSEALTCDFSKYKPFSMDHFLQLGLIKQAVPVYPAAAWAVGAGGIVRVKILVDRRGMVREACVIEGHPLLRASAIRASLDSRFRSNFGLSLPQNRFGRHFIQDELLFNFKSR